MAKITTKKLTTETWIEKAKEVHSNKYDYSKVIYTNSKTKVCIICFIHGEFWQEAGSHLSGHGCKTCRDIKSGNYKKSTTEEWIQKVKLIHNNKYDYSKSTYIKSLIPVCIICPDHGEFWQLPKLHLKGNGCQKCAISKRYKKIILTKEEFIIKSNKIHFNKYDYSKVEYINNKTLVCIICKNHGEFWQAPSKHMIGQGCSSCNDSKGELKIRIWLEENVIKYEYQKTFDNCKNIKKLPFDFYLPEYNLCIEFDGLQHYIPVEYFGGEEKFKKLKYNDSVKTKFCKDNDVKLLRIRYNQINNIETILRKEIDNVIFS